MAYSDAQHLLPDLPPDDGEHGETLESCADCGEPVPPDARLCPNCLDAGRCLHENGGDGAGYCTRAAWRDACAYCLERWGQNRAIRWATWQRRYQFVSGPHLDLVRVCDVHRGELDRAWTRSDLFYQVEGEGIEAIDPDENLECEVCRGEHGP